jgi:hypothetical protein
MIILRRKNQWTRNSTRVALSASRSAEFREILLALPVFETLLLLDKLTLPDFVKTRRLTIMKFLAFR